jgi:hypothetical protein
LRQRTTSRDAEDVIRTPLERRPRLLVDVATPEHGLEDVVERVGREGGGTLWCVSPASCRD